MSSEDTKEKILNLARKSSKGITDKDIIAEIPGISSVELVTALNDLLKQERFDLFNQNGSLIYKYVSKIMKVSKDISVTNKYSLFIEFLEKNWKIQRRIFKELEIILIIIILLNFIHFRLKTQTNKHAIKGADNEEKVVYNLIEEAGNKGIWIRDIRIRSNLANTQLTKVLKNLESKKVIKAVKCVNVSKFNFKSTKIYLILNLQFKPG